MNKLFKIILCLTVFIFMKSCTYSKSIDTRLFVSGIGIDINDDGDYSLCFSYPDISEFSPESSKIKGAGSVSGFGASFYEAISDVISQTQKTMDLDHVRILVASSKIVKDSKNFENLLDYLSHDSQVSRRVYVCVSDGDAKDVINFKSKSGEDSQVFISELIEHNAKENGITAVTLNNILDCFSQNNTLLLPVIKLNEQKTIMKMSGSYIMQNYTFIDELNKKDTMMLNFLRGNSFKIIDEIKYKDKNIDYESQNIDRKIKLIDSNNINLKFNLKTIIKNCIDNEHNYVYENFINEIKGILDNDINMECMNILNKFYKQRVDVLNLENYFYKFKPTEYSKKIKGNKNWMDMISIRLNLQNNITNIGNISF